LFFTCPYLLSKGAWTSTKRTRTTDWL